MIVKDFKRHNDRTRFPLHLVLDLLLVFTLGLKTSHL
jgi:hypothetical protein